MQNESLPPNEQEVLESLARQYAEADREAASLLMRQLAEDDLILTGRIDPDKGEYLAAFGPAGDCFVCDVRRPGL